MFRFTHNLLNLLEKYAQGKVLYVQTHKLRQNSKRTGTQLDNEEGALEYEQYNESHFQEKRFGFTASITEFVNYDIITNILTLLKQPKLLDEELIQGMG